MDEHTLRSLGFSVIERVSRNDHLHEVRADMYSIPHRDLITSFSASVRTSNGEQCLNTNSQFVQRHYLSREQIDAVTEWLRECVISARWRLTTYTTLVN